eukprot:CAMPEP_0185336004 /NCGR_PEP_ID=MMETSP1363-20130426/88793_1 /TAXON_ID=38817 /ORGANISM="Gephyrocapsa oceanica, Strain RCC1303" /LENGTH=169 /DNA_ID=CAMNT_0027935043 /DNA_START=39 /DNA_END=544 /DNA_ORIENTATION=-
MSYRVCFATVGTTQFDALTLALVSHEVTGLLARHGYSCLRLQIGRGAEPVLPSDPPPPIPVEWYRFKDSLEADMQSAALIISHAGAGSIMEGLRCTAPLLVAVNDGLMDNHQQELAHELDRRGHLIATTPRGLCAALEALPARAASLEPWPEGDATEFARYLGAALGVG